MIQSGESVIETMRKNMTRRHWLAAFIGGSAAALLPLPGLANPVGPSVAAGSVSISNPDNQTLLIQQGQTDAIINWQQFSIGSGESVIFNQPSASSAVLNRVTGGLPSEIFGNLSSNGRVFLVNPQGIVFGNTAQVDVGALVASSLEIGDADFLNGNYLFVQGSDSPAGISNAGLIRAADGGFVVLAADRTGNDGVIATRLGSVVLASGSALTLSLDAQSLVSFTLDAASASGLAQAVNNGLIDNAGGIVWMAAATAQSLAAAAVNNSGQIRAQALVDRNGQIFLVAAGGDLLNNGLLDVAGSSHGGSITLAGDQAVRVGDASALVASASSGSGGAVSLSGPELQLLGSLDLGAGGTLALEAGAVSIAPCAVGVPCSATLRQADLAAQLGAGVAVGIVSGSGISFEPLANGLLDGRAAAGDGGSLSLSAAEGIVFGQSSDQLLLDGALQASGGGSLLLGSLASRSSILIQSEFADLSVGSVTVNNTAGSALLGLFASEGLTVRGAIDVQGQLASGGTGEGFEQLYGARVRMGTVNGDIVLQGPVRITGSVASAAVADSSQVIGAELLLAAEFASIDVVGPVQLTGTLGTVTGGDELSARGALLQLNAGSGSARLGGALSLTGSVGSVTAGRFAQVQGAGLDVTTMLGNAALDGGATIRGSLMQATLGEFAIVAAADADLHAQFGAVTTGQSLQLDGGIGSVQAGRGSEIRAAASQLQADDFLGDNGVPLPATPVGGDIEINGGIALTGRIDNITVDGDAGVFGTVLFSRATRRNSVLGGALHLDGTLGNLSAGDDAYVLASFGTLLSDSARITLTDTAAVVGRTGTTLLGDRGQLTGAALWLDTSGPLLELGGGLEVSSTLGDTGGGFGVDINGAYAYLNAFFGSTTVAGEIVVDSTIAAVTAAGGASVTGSQLLSGSGTSAGYFNDLLIGGNIRQHASIGPVSFADPDTSTLYSGGVLLDAGAGRVAFRDISADNLFVYFDSDSTLTQSRLEIADYAEIFTASVAPVLSGGVLDIQAGELFLSVNTAFDNLSASSSGDLNVFFAALAADSLRLQAAGALQLTGSSLLAASMQLSGNAVYSDAESVIDAGALDVVAAETILLRGATRVGSGQAMNPGDTALLRQLALRNAELLPASAAPNAFFSAPTVGIAQLSMAGDYLRIRSDFVFLGALDFAQPQTVVHLDPLRNLPLFAESVDASVLGDQASKLPLNRGNVQPNIGSFSSVLGELPAVGAGAERTFTQLNFAVGEQLPSLQQLILDSGLRDSTLVIGGSGYQASIQISDQLAVDVRPSNTNFVLLTNAGILGADRIATNGKVVVLGGQQFTDAEAFYQQVVRELENFVPGVDEFNQSEDEATVEREAAQKAQECSE